MSDLEKYQSPVIEQRLASFESPPESESQSTSNMIMGILRQWYIVLLIFFVMCGIGIPAIWLSIKPLHSVIGAIRVAPFFEDPITGEADTGGISYQSFMQTQPEIITSSHIVQSVADDLKDKNLTFFKNESTGFVTKLKQIIKNTKSKPEPASILKQAISSGIISAVPANRTELIKITMKSTNAQEAVQIVDAFINVYTAIEVASSSQKESRKLARLEEDKKALEKRLRNYHEQKQKLGHNYGSTELKSRREMMLELVKDLRIERNNTKLRRIKLESQVKVLEETKEQSISPEDLMRLRNEYITFDPTVQKLAVKIVDLEENLLVSKVTLTDENPVLQQKEELLDKFRARFEEEHREAGKTFDDMVADQTKKAGMNKLHQMQAELEQSIVYEKQLVDELDKVNTSTIEIGLTQFTIDDLDFEQKFDEEAYETVGRAIRRLKRELRIPARISVAYPAGVASVRDKRIKYSMALMFGSMACGMMLAFLRDKADLRLRTPDDVVKRIGIRIIGTTTGSDTIKKALLPRQIAGDYQTIRANLRLLNGDKEPKILVIASPGMQEGKTTFAINLATSMSKSGKKVLLIDGDLRKPDIAYLLNLPRGSRGLQDLLFGRKKYHQAVYSVPATGLDVLAADSRNRDDACELLAMPGTRQNIKTISQTYDHVIIDTPPVLAFPDALVWAKMADAVILTSFANQTTAPDLREATEKLAQINANVLGTVLSNVSADNSYYRYGHNYYAQNARSRKNSKRAAAKLLLPAEPKS